MRKLFFLLFILFAINHLYSQKLVTFGEQRFGVKNRKTGKVLLPMKYDQIVKHNDSLVIVRMDDLGFAIVDTLNRIVYPYSKEELLFEKFVPEHIGQVVEKSTSDKGQMAYYYVDKKRRCIPYDNFPCPNWKKLTDSVPDYLKLVQMAIQFKMESNIPASNLAFERAIEAKPNNPYLYLLWIANNLTDPRGRLIKPSEVSNENIGKIKTFLDSAYNLSTTDQNHLDALSFMNQFYKGYLKDKRKLKNIDLESRKFNPTRIYNGWMIIPGVSYSNGLELEFGVGYGLTSRNDKPWHKPYFSNSAVFTGISYLKNVPNGIDGYKLYLLSIVKPLNISFFPVLYTNYKEADLVLRPEFGYGFEAFSFSVGYNLFVDAAMYKELNTVSFNLRFYLPAIFQKSYTVKR